jgi:hypothetical protein
VTGVPPLDAARRSAGVGLPFFHGDTPMTTRPQLARWSSPLLVLLAWLWPSAAFAAPAEDLGKLVHVADTRHLTGFNLFVADLYNSDRLLFTIFSVGLTAVLGLALGYVMDIAVGAIGLDLEKRHSRE